MDCSPTRTPGDSCLLETGPWAVWSPPRCTRAGLCGQWNVAEQMASCLQGQMLTRAQLPLGSLGSCSGGDGCLVSRQCPLETATWPPGDSRGGGRLQSSPQLEPRETPEPHAPSSAAPDACPSGVVRERLLSQDTRFWGQLVTQQQRSKKYTQPYNRQASEECPGRCPV